MPIKKESFDAIVSSFVLRNLPSTTEYFDEGIRVLKKGGIMANLDAFPEKRRVLAQFFSLYFYKLLPRIAKVASSSDSYTYLASTVKNFKTPEKIVQEMEEAGFSEVTIKRFVSPSAAIVYGRK
jgi:demethylmenaquinone methyltransferase/2-methoxy-6-polyprenyl-1,4-benzoquinol methylase